MDEDWWTWMSTSWSKRDGPFLRPKNSYGKWDGDIRKREFGYQNCLCFILWTCSFVHSLHKLVSIIDVLYISRWNSKTHIGLVPTGEKQGTPNSHQMKCSINLKVLLPSNTKANNRCNETTNPKTLKECTNLFISSWSTET